MTTKIPKTILNLGHNELLIAMVVDYVGLSSAYLKNADDAQKALENGDIGVAPTYNPASELAEAKRCATNTIDAAIELLKELRKRTSKTAGR